VKRVSAALIILCLALTACSVKTADKPIMDLVVLPQDASAYHGLDPNERLLPAEGQQKAYANFLAEFFSPWERDEDTPPNTNVFWGFEVYGTKKLYGENTLLRDPAWIQQMRKASRINHYPSLNRRAIAVTNISMRVFPTQLPVFFDFSRAGEGYPFDYMQNTLVLAGSPLHATHISADRAWVLVESRFAYGWVPVGDIGWVDDDFIAIYKTGIYGAITRDDVPVTDGEGNYRFAGHIGTILPIMEGGAGTNGFAFIIPVRTMNGDAAPHVAFLPQSLAQQTPIPATPANFTKLINAMMGRPYGWAGLHENRDCSSTTMDLMAPFGIALPRNSSKQIKLGTYVSLEGMSRKDKKTFITKTATPFMTLVRKPGHIMLYVGEKDGQPIIFHSVWGLKTKTNGKYGRKVIGKAVITSLEPGLEQSNLARPEGIILEVVFAISTLPGVQGE